MQCEKIDFKFLRLKLQQKKIKEFAQLFQQQKRLDINELLEKEI